MSADYQAWIDCADLLAAWAFHWLVNRSDVYGSYYLSGGARTVTGELTVERCFRHFTATDRSHLIGLPAISIENTSRWVAIDIDQHDEGNTQLRAANWQFVLELCRRIASCGLKPLATESNGRGGYHVRILFSEPIPSRDAHDLGNSLVTGWETFGLPERPEVYPKQPELTESVPIGNWLRLPGHHHTYSHTTTIWTDTEWLSGERAILALVSGAFMNSNQIPAEVLQEIRSRNHIETRRQFSTNGRPIGRVLVQLTDVRQSPSDPQQWRACCPAHPDTRPSLSVSETSNGTVLLWCHAGCAVERIVDSLGLEMRDLFPAYDDDENDAGPATVAEPSIDWTSLAVRFCSQLTAARLAELSARLGVSTGSLWRLNVGWDAGNRAYTFPEFDVRGQVIGIQLRAPDGSKWQVTGGHRGLTIPTGPVHHGPVYLPEGASDVAALLDQGANAIGRPSANFNCAEKLIELLLPLPNDVLVVGDRDGATLEESVGLRSALGLATELRARLGDRVKYCLPPESYKDVRTWLTSLKQ